MLDTQYRMHPQISAFPNRTFYASALTDGTVDHGTVKPGFDPPITDFLAQNDQGVRQNVTFLHHDSPEDLMSKSLRNQGEAGRVCDVVTDLLLQNPVCSLCQLLLKLKLTCQKLSGSDIGIITPYNAQIQQLKDDLLTNRRADIVSQLGIQRAQQVESIEIRTVDGFEGREKAVIIFNTVRNNPGGYIGFLADWRRLNVGLTRAKRVSSPCFISEEAGN
jgi:superfamily I DNA and/or RNA helicase